MLVIDSNVWISALVFGGTPRRVFEKVVQSGQIVVTSEQILSEVRRVISHKFPDFAEDFDDLLVVMRPRMLVVKLGVVTIDVCRDANDNMVVETAFIGQANYIVSGDIDLLILQKYNQITILSPADFNSLNTH